MAALADLQPDRRAVLKLLIGRGRGYDQIAELLQLPELVVRRRAHDAITELAGGKGDIDDAQRALLCDYLVGELPASRRAEARKLLADDAGARRFARGAAARLSGIEGAQLPELPAEDEEVAEALDALDARRERKVELETSSRRGGWFIIGGIAIVIVVAVVLASVVFTSSSDDSTNTVQGNDPSTSAPAATTGNTLVAELATPSGGGAAKGQAALKPNSTGATILALHATGLSPTKRLDDGRFTAFAFWLEGPSGVEPLRLGFYDPTTQSDGTAASDGTIDLGITLDGTKTPAVTTATLAKYTKIVITREILTSTKDLPTAPGNEVLVGTLASLG
ncbi:MAG: hypothetical protein AAGC46_08620 [Solirubrobacteraceae bacterium]|nr:hypothetical protein [Patulibacter sp.]